MRIGVDIDGVLTDCGRFITDYGTKFCIENNLTYRIRENQYDGAKALCISPKNEEKFWNTYLKKYITESKPRELSADIINKLKEMGHEIYIITSRNEWGLVDNDYGKMKEYTTKWLNDNKISYDKLVFAEGGKLPYCIGNYIDVLIEDAPKYVKEVSKKIPVLCFNNPYNEHIRGRNIKRVYSWYDVYNHLKIKTY